MITLDSSVAYATAILLVVLFVTGVTVASAVFMALYIRNSRYREGSSRRH